MRFAKFGRVIVLFVAAILLPGVLRAQSTTQGAISGTVVDPTNAVLPNVVVTLKSLDKGYAHDTTTSAQGAFQFPLIEPGHYEVRVTVAGFKQFAAKVAANVGQVTTVNVRLEVGAMGTTVEVSGVTPLMETESADMSTSFDQNLVENLPNGGNDLTAVAYTAPGVMMNSGGMYGNFTANGLPATSNVFTVDGENQMDPFLNLNNSGPTNLMLGKNSINEATVVTNAYSGQYGQQAGAQVNLVSKGGTNSFHGNVQYQWTGRALDANDWFNTFFQPAQPRPFSNNNQWAASFGGPIKKDKTFFFIDTEGIRYIVPSTTTVYTPTTAFLNDTINIGLPAAGASSATVATYQQAAKIWQAAPGFANGTPIPAATSCVDPLTGGQIDTTGTATAGCLQSYTASPAVPAKETLLIGRFDQNIGTRDRLFFRFDIDTGTQATYADPISNSFSAASYQPAYNNSLTWTHAFSGTATNQFVAALSYYRAIFDENTNGSTSPFPYSMYLGTSVGISSPIGLPSATGLNALNFNFPQGRNVTQYQFVDDFAKMIGRHSLKVGVNFRRYDITNYDASVLATPLVYAGLSDFYSGSASLYLQNNALHSSAPMNTGGLGLYAQDDWAITPRFKLTVGLRAEHNFNPTCDINCFTMLNGPFSQVQKQGANTPYNQALLTGRRDAFNSVDTIDWAPRLGFTWSPLANSKTVISGGIGFFYDAFPAFITDQFVNLPYLVGVTLFGPDLGNPAVAWGDPAGATATVTNTANTIRDGNPALGIPSLANGLTEAQLLAAGGAEPSVTGFPGKLRTPQYQEWSLQVQQEVDSKSRITVAYVGNHGIFEPYPNSTVNATSPSGVFGYASNTPDSRFGTVTQWTSGAISNHNALLASYSRRLTAGFVVNANYTWSHTLDEISNGSLLPSNTTAVQGQINPLNFRANNYGNADYDARHSFNANYVWNAPFHFQNRVLTGFLGGWMVSQSFVIRSGMPYTITDGTAATQNGGTTTPVEVLGTAQQNCVNGASTCFNSGQLATANGLGFFPNQMRNQYRGPGFFNSDFTVGKNFNITERMKLTVGANLYNIFNHPNFQNPHNSWTPDCSTIPAGSQQASCGNITGQAAPPTGPYGSFFNGLPAGRVGQLQAKIVF
jgi:outer membrane receptor protein involved in Fe transport